MKVQYMSTTGTASGDVTLTIKVNLSKSEIDEMTTDELSELVHSKLDRAVGGNDG